MRRSGKLNVHPWDGEQADLTSHRFDNDTSVLAIVVNDDEDNFCVHDELLAASSPYFRKHICSASYIYSGMRRATLRFPHWTAKNFNFYLNWLYGRKIATSEPPASGPKPAVRRNEDPEYITLAELYRFAIEIKVPKFQDAILDAFITKVESHKDSGCLHLPGYKTIRKMYDDFALQNTGQELMVDMYAQQGSKNLISNTLDWPAPFLTDLTKRLFDFRAAEAPAKLSKCKLHVHPRQAVAMVRRGNLKAE